MQRSGSRGSGINLKSRRSSQRSQVEYELPSQDIEYTPEYALNKILEEQNKLSFSDTKVDSFRGYQQQKPSLDFNPAHSHQTPSQKPKRIKEKESASPRSAPNGYQAVFNNLSIATKSLNHEQILNCNHIVEEMLAQNATGEAMAILQKCEKAFSENQELLTNFRFIEELNQEMKVGKNPNLTPTKDSTKNKASSNFIGIQKGLTQFKLIFQTYCNISTCYIQEQKLNSSYDYLIRALDAALRYTDIQKKFNQYQTQNKHREIHAEGMNQKVFASNEWIDRGIAETLYKITTSFFFQKNYVEAKKYALYSIQACYNCLKHLKNLIDENVQAQQKISRYAAHAPIPEDLATVYFEIVNLYILILKLLGSILEKTNHFDQAFKQYNLARTILLANFVDSGQKEFTCKEHEYEFRQNRRFVERYGLQPLRHLLPVSQKIQKELTKAINGTSLKNKYLDINELSQIQRNQQKHEMKRNTNQYIRQYIHKIGCASEPGAYDQQPDSFVDMPNLVLGNRLSSYMQHLMMNPKHSQKPSSSQMGRYGMRPQASSQLSLIKPALPYLQKKENDLSIKTGPKLSGRGAQSSVNMTPFKLHNRKYNSSVGGYNNGQFESQRSSMRSSVQYMNDSKLFPSVSVPMTSNESLQYAIDSTKFSDKKQTQFQKEVSSQSFELQKLKAIQRKHNATKLSQDYRNTESQNFGFGQQVSSFASDNKLTKKNQLSNKKNQRYLSYKKSTHELSSDPFMDQDPPALIDISQDRTTIRKNKVAQAYNANSPISKRARFTEVRRDPSSGIISYSNAKDPQLLGSSVDFTPGRSKTIPGAKKDHLQDSSYSKKVVFGDSAYGVGTNPREIADNERKSIGKHIQQAVDGYRQNDTEGTNMMSSSEQTFFTRSVRGVWNASPIGIDKKSILPTNSRKSLSLSKRQSIKQKAKERENMKLSTLTYQMRSLMHQRLSLESQVNEQIDAINVINAEQYKQQPIDVNDQFQKDKMKWEEEVRELKTQVEDLKEKQQLFLKLHKEEIMRQLIDAQDVLKIHKNESLDQSSVIGNRRGSVLSTYSDHQEVRYRERLLIDSFHALKDKQEILTKMIERSQTKLSSIQTQINESPYKSTKRKSTYFGGKAQANPMLGHAKEEEVTSSEKPKSDETEEAKELLKTQWKLVEESQTLHHMEIHAQIIPEDDSLFLRLFFEIIDKASDQIINGSQKVYEHSTKLPFSSKSQFLKLCHSYLPQVGFESQPYQAHLSCIKLIVTHLEEEQEQKEKIDGDMGKQKILNNIENQLKAQKKGQEDAESHIGQVDAGLLNKSLQSYDEEQEEERSGKPEAADMIVAIVRVKRALRRHVLARNAQVRRMSEVTRKRYIELADEQQNARSTLSRERDPVLPDEIVGAKLETCRQGMFVCSQERQYVFTYQIHMHTAQRLKDQGKEDEEDDETDSVHPSGKDVRYSWSLFAKIRGKTHQIWQYHRFQDEILDETLKSGRDEPGELLGNFVRKIAKACIDFVIDEAKESKAEFAVQMDKGKKADEDGRLDDLIVKNPEGKVSEDEQMVIDSKVKLTDQELERWENWWMDNLRQQTHLEL